MKAKINPDKTLKALLFLYGVYVISCQVLPTLGLFSSNMGAADWIGIAVLELGRIAFTPASIRSFLHF